MANTPGSYNVAQQISNDLEDQETYTTIPVDGDVGTTDTGLVVKSPNGTQYKVTVTDGGTLGTVAFTG